MRPWKKKYIVLDEEESLKDDIPKSSENIHVVRDVDGQVIVIENFNDYLECRYYDLDHKLAEAFNIRKQFIIQLTIYKELVQKKKGHVLYAAVIERADSANMNINNLTFDDAKNVYNFLCEHTGSKCSIKSIDPRVETIKEKLPLKKKKKVKSKKQSNQTLYPNLETISTKKKKVPEYKLPQNNEYSIPHNQELQQQPQPQQQIQPQNDQQYHQPQSQYYHHQQNHQYYDHHHHQQPPQYDFSRVLQENKPPLFKPLQFPKIPDTNLTIFNERKAEPLILL